MDGWEDSSSSDDSRWKSSKSAGATRSAGGGLAAAGQRMMSSAADDAARNIHPVSYKKGGRVKRTGLARLHKGEYVVPRGKVKRVKNAMRRRSR
jgi:hypothetical protein